MVMVKIVGASGEIPPGETPGRMLTVTLSVDDGTSVIQVNMQVEELNGSTRHHNDEGAKLRAFHMMCDASPANQLKVLDGIAADPGDFYNQLVYWNGKTPVENPKTRKNECPLTLFADNNRPPHDWRPVRDALLLARGSVRDSLDRVAALYPDVPPPTCTPCYGLMVSAFPDTYDLMDGAMTVVCHPSP